MSGLMEQLTDEQLAKRIAKHNRRTQRNAWYREAYKALQVRGVMRFRSRPSQLKAAAKKMVMAHSQRVRKAATA